MKQTLYVRIIIVTMGIMLLSGMLAFIAANVYYHIYLKPENDSKVTRVAESVEEQFTGETRQDLDLYLSRLTSLGYQFQLRDEAGNRWHFGEAFREEGLADDVVEGIFSGQTYHGIEDDPFRFYITGFFQNTLANTIGVPITVDETTYALFVRPDTKQQFGEMRSFLAIVLILLLGFSFLMILLSTRYLVQPLKQLAEATRRIASGNYHIELNVKRNDEIGRLATDFSKMTKALNESDLKREEFVSNVSHEIQSPLTSINGFSQALREEDLPEEMKNHYLSIIESESKRLSMLSKQLLTLSFLGQTEEESEFVLYNVAEQLKEVITSLRWQWQEKDLSVDVELNEAFVYGNPRLLYQVWHNLLSNAIRYTEPGGTVSIQLTKDKEHALVSVTDTGVGIDEADLPYLFERFYKVDTARVRTEGSTGLGLAIVQKIVQLHDGLITVQSAIGDGSTFLVTLPIVRKK